VATARPKTLTYEAHVTRDARVEAEGCDPLVLGPHWQAEHLLLAGLVRCSITSLEYHVRRIGGSVEASGFARGSITKRPADGRYAFVEIECEIEAELTPPFGGGELRELLAKAEHDCFLGASLTISPRYRWTVNGGAVA